MTTQPSSEARHFCQKFNWCVLVPEHEGACSSYAITKQTIAEPSAAPASPTPPQKEYFATGYSREDLSAMHPDIELTPDPAYKKCPQCKRENTIVTWEKFGGKCPNCSDLFDKDRAASASTESPKPQSATTKVNDANELEPFWWEKSATPFDLARGLAFRTFPAENGSWPVGFGPNALADYAVKFCEENLQYICGHGQFEKPCMICRGTCYNAIVGPLTASPAEIPTTRTPSEEQLFQDWLGTETCEVHYDNSAETNARYGWLAGRIALMVENERLRGELAAKETK